MAPVVTISVYSSARLLNKRHIKRQCLSLQSMSGAVQKR
jgi:hypothetical protein